jgi:hypothetical protein
VHELEADSELAQAVDDAVGGPRVLLAGPLTRRNELLLNRIDQGLAAGHYGDDRSSVLMRNHVIAVDGAKPMWLMLAIDSDNLVARRLRAERRQFEVSDQRLQLLLEGKFLLGAGRRHCDAHHIA